MKADAAHVVPLSEAALAVLADLPRFKSGEYLFSTTFGRKPVSGYSKAKTRLDRVMLEKLHELTGHERAKLEPFVIHDIRRTMRTGLSALPIPDLVRELVIAHTKPGLHKVYDRHGYGDEKAKALELWAARVRDIVKPSPANVVAIPARA
jgi:integrase